MFPGGTASVLRLTQGAIEISEDLTLDGSDALDLVITGDADGDDAVVSGTSITDVDATGTTGLADNTRLFEIGGQRRFRHVLRF